MRSSLVIALLLLPAVASAVPVELTHQGRLFDANGDPLVSTHDLKFELFDAPAGGAVQWEETLSAVVFDQGYYAVDLGQGTPLDLDMIQNASELWVSISVDTGPALPQRLPFVSVPYALVAARADVATSVSGGTVDATSLTINGAPVIADDGTINWSQITGAPQQLGDLNCNNVGQVPQWNGADWGCIEPNAHNHSADQITSGTLDMTVIPVGSSANTVARGAHTHTAIDVDMGALDPTNPLNHDRYTNAEAIAAVGPHYTDDQARAAVGPHYTDNDAILAVGPHFTNADATAAMGALDPTNPLNHDRYTNAEAVAAVGPHYTNSDATAAMGALDPTNPLNHDRYTNAEAVAAVGPHYTNSNATAAMGPIGDTNPLNHARYTNTEAVAAMGTAGNTNPLNHARYTNAEAVVAMGSAGDTNPLNHARYSNAEAVLAMGGTANGNTLNHDRYTNTEAVAAMGTKGNTNALNHDRYANTDAVAAMGTKGNTNALNHDRYTNTDAVAAMGTKGNTNALNHDRYTNTEAVAAVTAAQAAGTAHPWSNWKICQTDGDNGGDAGTVILNCPFTKQFDATYIRATYNDNLRVYGHGGWCQWEIEWDAQRCQAPSFAVRAAVYNSQDNGVRNNDHQHRQIDGTCQTLANGTKLTAGAHTVRVRISAGNTDCYTGWNETTSLLVEEIW